MKNHYCILKIKRITQIYALVLATGFLGLYGAPQLFAVPIYSSGDFRDPSSDPLHPTDRSQSWIGASNFSGAKVLAESFSLSSDCVLSSVNLWAYDTTDGSTAHLAQVQYAIYLGSSQPSGVPLASGLGKITSSTVLSGHNAGGLQVIATAFDLATQLQLAPGVTYWLALAAFTDPFGVSNRAQWAEANVPGGSYRVQDGSGWDSLGGERAFMLDGSTSAPAGVPDGGPTLSLLTLALAAIGLLHGVKGRQQPSV